MLGRPVRLFGTLAALGLVVFVLGLAAGLALQRTLVGTPLFWAGMGGFYAFLGFGLLWFACWALSKLWKR
jgi:uncharacterized transporter YbjL